MAASKGSGQYVGIWERWGEWSEGNGQVVKTTVWTSSEKESGKRKTSWMQYIF